MLDETTISHLKALDALLPDLNQKLTDTITLLSDIAELSPVALDSTLLVVDQFQLLKNRICEIKRIS